MSAVQFHEISKTFTLKKRQVVALQDISATIKEHEFVSIVGPSGCGKSTLLLLTAGLVPATSGRIQVDNRPVTDAITDVGMVFQRDVLFDWRTVIGNVMLQADIRRLPRRPALEKAQALLQKVGLGGFEQAYPWQLSGGMRQRVAICRALLHDASLLLMDEPFGALDALTRDQMALDLLRIWSEERRTAVFITHDIAEAVFLSDRVLVMSPRPGRIVADIKIDLRRPRELEIRDEPQFVEYQRQIRKLFASLQVIG
jgi:NitT/TauT family transport system ATP-binding protein